MNALITFAAIIFISAIGYVVIRGFNLIKDDIFAIGSSFGLGIGLVAFELYIFSSLNIPWEKSLLILPWVVSSITIIFINKRNFAFKLPKFPRLRKVELILLAMIFAAILYTCFEALIRPATAWDSWANWLIESKAFFIDGKINPITLNYLMSDYPLVFKLAGTFIYIILGHVDDSAVLFLSSAFYIFLAISFLAVLKRRFGIGYALFFTFFLVTIQNFIRHGGRLEAGQADLPIGYFAFISTVLLLEYLKKSNVKTLILLNILLGTVSLIKFEGLLIAVAIEACLFALFLKEKSFKHAIYSLLWMLPFLEWLLFRKINNVGSYYLVGHGLEISIQKSINAVYGTIREFFDVKTWNLLWIVYIYLLIRSKTNKNVEFVVLNFIILSQITIYVVIYILTAANTPESSIQRLLVHIAPIALFYIAIQPSVTRLMKAR